LLDLKFEPEIVLEWAIAMKHEATARHEVITLDDPSILLALMVAVCPTEKTAPLAVTDILSAVAAIVVTPCVEHICIVVTAVT
jgi:hypothetical protein